MDNQMSLTVDLIGDSSSVVSAADQAGSAIKGFEGVSDTAIASLTSAIDKLNINFDGMGGAATKSAASVKEVGAAAGSASADLEAFTGKTGLAARGLSAMGLEAGGAAARVEGLMGVMEEMGAMAPELLAIGASIAAIGSAFAFVKDGIQDAAQLQQSMDQLKAVVDEQKGSWSAASEEIKKFIETESMASGISETELASAFADLAGQIHNVHDAMVIMRVAEEEHIATGKSLTEVTNALLEAEAGRGMTLAQLDPRLKNIIHDHADMHTILKVLHDDNSKALEDQNNANMSWARAKVALEVLGETIGSKMLPALRYLGEMFIGLVQAAGEFGKAIGTGIHGAAFMFVDSVMAMVHAGTALWDVLHGNFGGAKTEMGKALQSLKSDVKDLYDATIGYIPGIIKGFGDLFHAHAIGHGYVNEAIYQHDHAMDNFSLDDNPTVGFGKSGRSGHSRSGKSAIPTLGGSEATILYDDSIQMTTKDQQKFTTALYATGDALAKQIIGLDKSREANEKKNADERATYGMSLEQEVAYYQKRLANLDKFDGDYLKKKAELENKIDDLETQEYKKQIDAAKKAHDEQLKLIDDWASKGVALFNTFFERGKNGFKSFADAFKQMLDNMVQALERSALKNLLAKIFNVNMDPNAVPGYGGSSSSIGGSAGGGLLGSIASAFGLGGGATGVAGSAFTGAAGTYDASLAQAYVASGISPTDAVSMASGTAGGGSMSGLSFMGSSSASPYVAAFVAQQMFAHGMGEAHGGGAHDTWASIGALLFGFPGAFVGSLFGPHFNPANEPDIYQTDLWGQSNADMNGNTAASPMNANGRQFTMDQWTQQATHGKGWNLTMEAFVKKFRGKASQLPQSLQGVFQDIEQLWGGADGQPNFNHDGKDGYLDIGSGKRAKYTEFWQYVTQYGPLISQLMDNYQSASVYDANGSTASLSGSYTPDGSPYILHDFPDYGGGGVTPPASSGGGGTPSPTPSPSPSPGGGPSPHPGPIHNPKFAAPVVVNQYISGNLLTEQEVYRGASMASAQYARTGATRRMNLIGKK